jgi:hypothetical protein
MPLTYEPVASVTLTADTPTITFNNIPATYTDLRVVITYFRNSGGNFMSPVLRLNSDASLSYSTNMIYGNRSGTSGNRYTSIAGFFTQSSKTLTDGTNPAMVTYDLLNYAGSTHKPCLFTFSLDVGSSGTHEPGMGMWRNTAAITSITLYNFWSYEPSLTAEFGPGTIVSIYGIEKA